MLQVPAERFPSRETVTRSGGWDWISIKKYTVGLSNLDRGGKSKVFFDPNMTNVQFLGTSEAPLIDWK